MINLREIKDLDELLCWRKEVILNVFGSGADDALMKENFDYYSRNIYNGSHRAFIAGWNGEDAGCGGICFTEELPSPDNPSGRCGYLMNIYVRDRFRDNGIGHKIVSHLIDVAKNNNCGKIYLETTSEGRILYESLGFKDLPDMMKLSD